ncbi:zinc-dependent dehydrogenase [soil metagenome]
MRVARLHAWGDVRVETVPAPVAGPGEIVIRVTACGLCGSDALDWYVARKAPVVLGHEPAGIVVDIGEGVTELQEGQRVFVHHHGPCMQCVECARRLWSNCATWRSTQLDPGGFAEYARVPAPNVAHDVLALPPSLSDEGATFIEPLACCLRAVHKSRSTPDDAVLILGLGAMGLLLAQLARVRGVAAVYGCDLRGERRADALTLLPGLFDAVFEDAREVKHRTVGRGADIVIVTPGTSAAIGAGLGVAAPGARVVCFTPLDPATPLQLDQTLLYFREIELLQSYSCGPDETRAALDLLSDGRVRWQPLVTHRVGLEGVAAALQRAHAAVGLKTIILPHTRTRPADPARTASGRE